MEAERRPLRVAIVGSGNIGTDLMVKIERAAERSSWPASPASTPSSDGLARAARPGSLTTTSGGLRDLLERGRGHRTRLRRDLGSRPRRARRPARRAGDQIGRPDPCGPGPGGGPVGQPRASTSRRPTSTSSPAARRRPCRSSPRSPRAAPVSLRRDRLDDLGALGRAWHPAEHRRVHADDRAARWKLSAAPAAARRSSSSTPPSRRS